MSKVVQFSENQIVYSSQDGERYRVPIGDKYEVSVIKMRRKTPGFSRGECQYGVELDYMSRNQLLTVAAKLIDVTDT